MGLRTWSDVQGSVVGQAIYKSGFEWQVTNSDEDRIANNRSLVSVRMWLRSTSGVGYSFNTNYNTSWKEHDGGNRQNISTAYDLRNISGTGKYYVGDGTSVFPVGSYFSFYITHNGDGTRTLPITTYLYGGTGGFNSATTSTTVTLPPIPRYAAITTFTFARKSGGAGINTAGVTWATNDACDTIQYSLNSGGWVTASGSGTSGNFNITSLSPATYYTLKIRVKRTSSQLWTESGALNITTFDIAKITSITSGDLNVDNNFTVNFTNPSGTSVQMAIFDGSIEFISWIVVTGTSYTFTAENNYTVGSTTKKLKEWFYSDMSTVNNKNYYIYLNTYTHPSYMSYQSKNFVITNANPTFTNFTINDIDPITTTLTNTTSKFVEGYSDVEMGITTGNKAVAIKGATMSHYLVTSENFSDSVPYGPSNKVSVTIPNIVSNSVTVTAVDSRGNTKEVTKTGTLLEYFNVTASGTCVREGTLTEEVELNISGTFWNSSFGSVTNTLNMTYEYKKSGGSWVAGTSTPTIVKTGNNFTILGNIKGDTATGFDIANQYDIKVTITDELDTVTSTLVIPTSKPWIVLDDNGVGIRTVYDSAIGGALQVGGDTYIDGDTELGGALQVGGDTYIDGDTELDGALQVNGNITTTGPVAINQPYDETLGGALQVNGAVDIKDSSAVAELKRDGNTFISNTAYGTTIISSTGTSDNTIYFRPNGTTNTTNQLILGTNGASIGSYEIKTANTTKRVTLYTGPSSGGVLNTTVNITLSETLANYQMLLVVIGTSGNEVVTVPLSTGYVAGIFDCRALSSYYAIGEISSSGATNLGFKVREVGGWSASVIKINYVFGIKL